MLIFVRMLQLAGSWVLLHCFSAISRLAVAAQQGNLPDTVHPVVQLERIHQATALAVVLLLYMLGSWTMSMCFQVISVVDSLAGNDGFDTHSCTLLLTGLMELRGW